MNQRRLEIEPVEFKAVLQDFRPAINGKKTGQVRVSFENGQVCFQCQGAMVKAAAQGQWHGIARFPVPFLNAVIKVPFSGDCVVLRYEQGRFFFNNAAIAAEWEDISPPSINISLNAPLVEILLLRYLYSEPQIISSGLMPQLDQAEQEATDKVRNAAKLLSELDVDAESLAHWIRGRLEEKAAQRLQKVE